MSKSYVGGIMTPCLVVFIGVLCTVANVDTRLLKRSDANKARRSSRNGIQYIVPQSRRFSSSTFRREAQDDLGSGLASSIQKQVADQISFQQGLQKKIQDRVQQKLTEKYKELEDKLTNDDSQSQWYIPNNSWWPDDSLGDNGDNSFLIFGPGSMSRTLSRNNAKTRRLSTETVSERMSDYNTYPAGPRPPPPHKGPLPPPNRPPPPQSSVGGPVAVPSPVAPSDPSSYVPAPAPAPALAPAPAPATGQIQVTIPAFEPMMSVEDLNSIPGMEELMKLIGIDLSHIDLPSILEQVPDISKIFSMEGLTGGAIEDALDLIEPYSLSYNNGKTAWNVNYNPAESARRQYDEFSDGNQLDEQAGTNLYDDFNDLNQLDEQANANQYDEWADANQYVPSEEFVDENAYNPANAYDETDPFGNIDDFSEFEQYIPEDTTSLVDSNGAYQDGESLDEAQQLSSEECQAIQENCAQCIQDAAAFDSKYNPLYGSNPEARKRRNLFGRKFRTSRRSNRRRYSPRNRRQYEQLDQASQYVPEESYGQDESYNPYENNWTYDQYDPAEQVPADPMSGSDCQTIEKTCAQCIVNAMTNVNEQNYDNQLDQQYEQLPDDQLDNPYGDIQRRSFNRFRKNRRANRASRSNRRALRRRSFA